MRRIKTILQTGSAAIIVAGSAAVSLPAAARAASNAPSLVISQLKITSSNGQFITLYNSTDATLDMSKYQLEYFNSYDPDKATSSRLISLTGIVPPHGYFMVNDSALMLCYRLTVDSILLRLSSTAGLVEVLDFGQSNPGSAVTPVLQDFVGWSKTAAAGAQTLPGNTEAFLQRQPSDAQNNPSVNAPGSGSWQPVQPAAGDACQLAGSTDNSAIIPTGLNQLLPPTEPPATIVSLNPNGAAGSGTTALPPADIGLMAPAITEILPNPLGSGNDNTDEFVELYNPNDISFNLSGFSLQVGTTALHDYTFPADSSLPPQSFTAFYSAATGLSLSNNGGQAKLLDPSGNTVSATGTYGSAKDGQAWALANGKWYWTTKQTPGAANVIDQPVTSKKPSAKTAASGTNKTKASKAKTSTAKTKAAKSKTAKTSKKKPTSTAQINGTNIASTTPIHPWMLALVAGLALLYGAYEYRADLRNRIYKLRSYFAARRADRA